MWPNSARGLLSSLAALLGLVQWPAAEAYPSGAPASACRSLRPGHGIQTVGSPVQIGLEDGVGTYASGQNIKVKVSGSNWKGLILQVRRRDGSVVGQFIGHPPEDLKFISCSRDADTATHHNRNLKSSKSFVWQAPLHNHGDLQFVASVVAEYATWHAVQSVPLRPVGFTGAPVPSQALRLNGEESGLRGVHVLPRYAGGEGFVVGSDVPVNFGRFDARESPWPNSATTLSSVVSSENVDTFGNEDIYDDIQLSVPLEDAQTNRLIDQLNMEEDSDDYSEISPMQGRMVNLSAETTSLPSNITLNSTLVNSTVDDIEIGNNSMTTAFPDYEEVTHANNSKKNGKSLKLSQFGAGGSEDGEPNSCRVIMEWNVWAYLVITIAVILLPRFG